MVDGAARAVVYTLMGVDVRFNRDALHCPTCGASFGPDFRVCPRDGVPLAQGADPLIGLELRDTYRITHVLGEGALGRVYHAEHIRFERSYAVKVPRGIWIDHPKSRARFFNEAMAAGRLAHPNVAGVVDYGTTAHDVPYLVMEFAYGVPLSHLIEYDAVPFERALGIIREIAQGLDHAHGLGIVHRDLKPDNVLVQGEHPRIVDFGIALVTELGAEGRLTTKGIVIGTPGYMAPEQLLDEPTDGRADLYALGVMLYELLTGRQPFDGTAVEVAQHTISGAPPPLLERAPWLALDARVDELCKQLMARRPEDRPRSARDVIAAIDRIAPPAHPPEPRARGTVNPPRPKAPEQPTVLVSPSLELEAAKRPEPSPAAPPEPPAAREAAWWKGLLWWRRPRAPRR